MRIGILGGGQLSRMLALAGYPLGLEFTFLEPNQMCCSENLGTLITASYQDEEALLQLVKSSDVITYENENIPVSTLEFLMKKQKVFPSLNALEISQDRLFEKNLFTELGIKTASFSQIDSVDDLVQAMKTLRYPAFLKQRRHGYDGKGQVKILDENQLRRVDPSMCRNAIVEEGIAFDREVSLIAVRSPSNDIKFYDISENVHQDGILMRTQNKPHDPIFELAQSYLTKIMHHLSYVGVLCVEFFQVKGELIANEMAPRVHNSGHWTIEGAVTSQFENHLRAIVDWPLGETRSVGLATMHNLLGHIPEKTTLLAQPGLHLHDYHKEPKPGRKLGHTTKIDQVNQ